MRVVALLFSALLLGLVPAPAYAWTARTRARMIDDAIGLMPPPLRLALVRYEEQVTRGAQSPVAHEDGRALDLEALEERLTAAATELVRGVEDARPFREIATRFGVLAHTVADAGFPPAVSGESARHYGHFAKFCESRRARFPLVFYGYEDPALARGDFRAFARAVIARARRDADPLTRSYLAAGNAPAPVFDDRSVPFAVASLSYSRTVTDIARAWLRAWADAHGDVEETPYGGPTQ